MSFEFQNISAQSESGPLSLISTTTCHGISILEQLRRKKTTTAFLGCSSSAYPSFIKSQCYTIFVRPIAEYVSIIWDCVTQKYTCIYELEMVHKTAARLVTGDYITTSSITKMLKDIQWSTLLERRRKKRSPWLTVFCNFLLRHHRKLVPS